jgi:hypothetical protein
MNANNNDNEWTTVRSSAWGGGSRAQSTVGSSSAFGSRQMPSAFSGRGGVADDYVNRRREQDRMNAEAEAAIKAREARERREALEAVRAKERDALALNSETSYPSLGVGAAGAAKPTTTLNFSRTVAAMAAREKAEEEERASAAAASLEYSSSSDAGWVPTPLSRRRFIGTRCFDDGPEDYNGPEEFDDDDDVSVKEEEEEGTGEFNAELAVTHRRGDKNGLY